MSFDNYCANEKIISGTYFWEKFKLTDFSRIIKHDKCQGRYYKGPQCILPNIVQMIGPFFWDLSGRLKKNVSKNSCFHGGKSFWSILPRIIECDRDHAAMYKGLQTVLTSTVEVIRAFLKDLRGCWKQKFFKKKAKFAMKKTLWPIFSRTIEHENCQRTNNKSPEGVLAFIVQMRRSFLGPTRSIEKNFSKK